jgi:hypothetical protein
LVKFLLGVFRNSSAFSSSMSPPVSSSTTFRTLSLCSMSAFSYCFLNAATDPADFLFSDILNIPLVSMYPITVPSNVSLCLVMSKREINSLEFCPSVEFIRYSLLNNLLANSPFMSLYFPVHYSLSVCSFLILNVSSLFSSRKLEAFASFSLSTVWSR